LTNFTNLPTKWLRRRTKVPFLKVRKRMRINKTTALNSLTYQSLRTKRVLRKSLSSNLKRSSMKGKKRAPSMKCWGECRDSQTITIKGLKEGKTKLLEMKIKKPSLCPKSTNLNYRGKTKSTGIIKRVRNGKRN
jgi:hypothetical protein